MNGLSTRPIKFLSATGALIVLGGPGVMWAGIPLAYKLDGVWYAGMYRPVGYLRRPLESTDAVEWFEWLPLTSNLVIVPPRKGRK